MRKKELESKVTELNCKLNNLEHRFDLAMREINMLQRRVTSLQCHHKNVYFEWSTLNCTGRKRCKECGEILETYDSELEYKEAQVEYHRQKANEIEAER